MLNNIRQFEGLEATINTGESCNLACKYCYEVAKQPVILPLDYAKKFIDYLLDDDDPVSVRGTETEWFLEKGLIIDFIGGDSLMMPDLVDSILQYYIYQSHMKGHRWADNWRASITTNGTLFAKKEVRDFVEKYHDNLSLTVSIDGCPEIHDKNRVFVDGHGSMDEIKKWWPWYRNLYPIGQTKSTLNKDSIPYLYDSLVYMHKDMDLTYINQNFIFEDMKLDRSDLDLLDAQMEKCVQYVLDNRNSIYWSMIDPRLANSVSYEINCRDKPGTGWCGSGAMPALSPNGKIYPCFRFLPHTQSTVADYSVGDVWSGFNRKENFLRVREATREKISPEKCKKCDIESGCAWCIGGSVSETGKLGRQTYICETQKIQDKWAKYYWDRISKEK